MIKSILNIQNKSNKFQNNCSLFNLLQNRKENSNPNKFRIYKI